MCGGWRATTRSSASTKFSRGKLPRRALLITFDDGYRSIAEFALPILRQLELPSVFFVTGRVPAARLTATRQPSLAVVRYRRHRSRGSGLNPNGRRTGTFPQLLDLVAAMPYERRLAVGSELADHFDLDEARLRAESRMFLDPEDLAGLAAYGCEVANHTRTHVFCRSIVDETSAHTELVEHARRLESLTGRAVRAFSYPYGRRDDATPMVERVLRESGHEAIFLAESRPHLTGTLGRLWNRVTLDGCPAWRVVLDLEVKPALRAGRDRMRAGRRPGVTSGGSSSFGIGSAMPSGAPRATPGRPRADEGSRPEDGEL